MCKPRQHDLRVILRSGPSHEQRVVRWCKDCGAVVVDMDFDGRTNAGQIMKMKLPTVRRDCHEQ